METPKKLSDNEIIAEFMGLKFRVDRDGDVIVPTKNPVVVNVYTPNRLWDDLMLVVEKINDLLDDGKLQGFDMDIFRSMQDWILSCKIENAHKDVVTIIKWYNTQNQPS